MTTAIWQIQCTDGKKDSVTMGVGKTVIGRGHLLQVHIFFIGTRFMCLILTASRNVVLVDGILLNYICLCSDPRIESVKASC
mgnify:CR=1 FL=1